VQLTDARADIARLTAENHRLVRLYAHGISGLLGDAGDVIVPDLDDHVALWTALVAYVERLRADATLGAITRDWYNCGGGYIASFMENVAREVQAAADAVKDRTP